MKIVAWIGNEPNQKALVNKINKEFSLSGLVIESRVSSSKMNFIKIFEKIFEKVFLPSIDNAWFGMKKHFENSYSTLLGVPTINLNNINSNETVKFTKNISPDLIIVSGTSLIKKDLLVINPSIGIINLHTGLSPYIKGGPNCTNWCIATKQFHYIGNTIMWIDKGIDTGNIITSEPTKISDFSNLRDVHITVMEHAHDLYLKAIKSLLLGNRNSTNQNEISKGTTYYSKQWTLKHKINLVKNFKNFKNSSQISQIHNQIITIKLKNY